MATNTDNSTNLSPQLADVQRQIDAVVRDAWDLVNGLSPEQFNWRPAPGKWSVGDCLDHLNSVIALYLPMFTDTLAQARVAGKLGSGPFRYGWLLGKFVRSMEPPPRLKVKTVASMDVPESSRHDVAAVMERFVDLRRRFDQVIASAEGVDLRRARLTSVISRFIKMPLGQWFQFMVAHDRRHIWQAREVLKREGFPGA